MSDSSDENVSHTNSDASDDEEEIYVKKPVVSLKPVVPGKNIIEVEENESGDEEEEDDIPEDDEIINKIEDDDEDVVLNSDADDESSDTDEEVIKKVKPTIENNIKNNLTLTDYDTDEDENDEKYLQKFDKEMSQNSLMKFHPECMIHNYDEIAVFTKIVKNNAGIIIDPLHRTAPYLTKYEKARVLGQRAKQIEHGAKPFVRIPENIIDAYLIADLELKEKKIPFIIRRPLPNGACEYWKLADLDIIHF